MKEIYTFEFMSKEFWNQCLARPIAYAPKIEKMRIIAFISISISIILYIIQS